MPLLVVTEGGSAETVHDLRGSHVTVGRAPDNAVCLNHRTVSRYHAVLSEGMDGWTVRDLGSHNGTRVNDKPVVESPLADRDAVRFGSVGTLFLLKDGAEGEALTPIPEGKAEITQTIRLRDVARFEAAGVTGGGSDGEGRLGCLLSLAEMGVSMRNVEALLDAAARSLRETLPADRVIPIMAEDYVLRPYVVQEGHYADDCESVGVDMALLETCRRDGVAAAWRATSPCPNVACAPMCLGDQCLGWFYCERRDKAAGFAGKDLAYLLGVAVQTAAAVENVRSRERLFRRLGYLDRQLSARYDIVGSSPAMQQVFEFIRKAAPTDAGVLICGESGTGKEMVARALHRQSGRAAGPLEVVNCGALPAGLIESELFGHVRGAFTGAIADKVGRFELAHGGTLFLDEVVELPVECQSKLLRVLEEGRVRRVGDVRDRRADVRLIAATNRDVDRAVAERLLRQDLYFRLDRLRVVVPPLRDRGEDVAALAEHFLAQSAAKMQRRVSDFAPEVRAALRAYRWPGNVRELRNVVERMVILAEDPILGLELLPDEVRQALCGSDRLESLEELERDHILRTLRRADGNKTKAAEMLGIDRSTLYAKLKRYGLDPDVSP
jgi:DNA-binding NtrC family response regulator